MPYQANHSIVVGKAEDAKTIVAGDPLPTLPADEVKRLLDLGAIGPVPVADTAVEPLVPAGKTVAAKST